MGIEFGFHVKLYVSIVGGEDRVWDFLPRGPLRPLPAVGDVLSMPGGLGRRTKYRVLEREFEFTSGKNHYSSDTPDTYDVTIKVERLEGDGG